VGAKERSFRGGGKEIFVHAPALEDAMIEDIVVNFVP